MTDKLLIDRELLERLLYVMDNYVTHETPEEDQLRAILAQTAAPADGEAVEVVASIAVDAEDVVRDFTLEPGLDRHPGGYTVAPLMTVAQHQRILPTIYQKGFDAGRLSAKAHADNWRDEAARLKEQLAQRDAKLAGVVEALKDARWAMQFSASCQAGTVERCKCSYCVYERIDAALAACGVEP